MRKIVVALLVLVGLAGVSPASAQETYSVGPVSAGNVQTLTDLITYTNAKLCLTVTPASGISCTQAQVCTAMNLLGGASCTAATARAANARIWPNTQAGREEYVTWEIASKRFDDLAAGLDNLKENVRKLQFPLLTTTAKNNACAAMSLPAGCFP